MQDDGHGSGNGSLGGCSVNDLISAIQCFRKRSTGGAYYRHSCLGLCDWSIEMDLLCQRTSRSVGHSPICWSNEDGFAKRASGFTTDSQIRNVANLGEN
jgi:hypothetical protein